LTLTLQTAADDNSGMEDKSKRSGAAAALLLGAVLVLLPMLYVLSIGPVARMLEDGWISKSWEPTLESAYFPVIWAVDTSPAVDSVMTNYMHMWVPRNQTVNAVPPATPPAPAPAPPAQLPNS
jgi:hypothetical protein